MVRNHSLTIQERLSALADGELCADDIGELLDAMEADPAALETWTIHHANAAVIRGERVSAVSGDIAFWQSIQEQLNLEVALPVLTGQALSVPVTRRSKASAANEPFWRIRSLAAFAMVLAVGCLTALFLPLDGGLENLAAAGHEPVPVAAAIPVADGNVMLRDPELDALMAAHQQMGGHSALQAPSGFLRNATYERPAR